MRSSHELSSHTGVDNLDLTNRCNLTCPVCFANANAAGYVYQPTLDDVRKMILNYRAERPTPRHIIQFSGGEPTIYPHFIEACRLAKDLGISWVQVASNGIAFTDPAFAFRAKESGLDGIYLQFDDTAWLTLFIKKTRGESLFKKKLQAIENAGKADLYVVLVCTVVRGVNNHQVGEILKFGIEHCDTVSGVAFQPMTRFLSTRQGSCALSIPSTGMARLGVVAVATAMAMGMRMVSVKRCCSSYPRSSKYTACSG